VIKAIQGSIVGTRALHRHLEEIAKRLDRGAHVRVGFLASATYPAGANENKILHVAQVAFWNEFGTRRIPSRPFFRTMIDRKSPRWGVGVGNALRKSHYNAEAALAIVGASIAGQLKDSINAWTDPPNSERWAKIKGWDKPLIHTSLMVRSVDFQVLRGDGGEDTDEYAPH